MIFVFSTLLLTSAICPDLPRGDSECSLDACSALDDLQPRRDALTWGELAWTLSASALPAPEIFVEAPAEAIDPVDWEQLWVDADETLVGVEALFESVRRTAGPCAQGDCWQTYDDVVLPFSLIDRRIQTLADRRIQEIRAGGLPFILQVDRQCALTDLQPCTDWLDTFVQVETECAASLPARSALSQALARYYVDGKTLLKTSIVLDQRGALASLTVVDVDVLSRVLRRLPDRLWDMVDRVDHERLQAEYTP